MCFAASAAHALVAPASANIGPNGSAASAGPPLASSEVRIESDVFGVGKTVRPGDWAGVRLMLTDRSDRPRNVTVRLWVPDPDGDTTLVQREITLNPGVSQSVWLYTRLPWRLDHGTSFNVTAHLPIDAAADAAQRVGVPTGRQIGAARVLPTRVVLDHVGLIGVVGRAPAGGLSAYSIRPDGAEYSGTANEVTEIITDIRPADLPDRWLGYAPYEAIVWLEGHPDTIDERQAEALREWVRRGGRLIIALPSFGERWTSPRDNPVHDIMPVGRAQRAEGVDLNAARALLRPRDDTPLPRNASAHVFSPTLESTASTFMPILNAPGLGTVVVRRLVGAGEVTLIGFDLSENELALRVDAQSFWHRVIGRRFEALSREELRILRDTRQGDVLNRMQSWVDADIGADIARTGRAGVGVLLGLVVFVLYLLLAGPLGYAALKMKKQVQHSWAAFVATTAVFTLVAWAGATTLRPTRADALHLTHLDHVFGQPTQRARVWFGAHLPDYGESTVAIGSPQDRAQWRNALSPWDSPSAIPTGRFPDTRGYVSDAGAPDALRVPTRSTVKQFQADWAGTHAWRTPIPVDGALRVEDLGGRVRVDGRIAHDLPAPLRDVTIVLVHRQRPLGTAGAPGMAPLPSAAYAWRLSGAMEPGVAYDLGAITADQPSLVETYFDRLSTEAGGPPVADAFLRDRRETARAAARNEALAWFPMLAQPEYLSRSAYAKRLLQRRSAHTLDLGRWFTQPCLIIVGQMENAPTPVPLFVDDAPLAATGRTVLRWVYPLAPSPPPAATR